MSDRNRERAREWLLAEGCFPDDVKHLETSLTALLDEVEAQARAERLVECCVCEDAAAPRPDCECVICERTRAHRERDEAQQEAALYRGIVSRLSEWMGDRESETWRSTHDLDERVIAEVERLKAALDEHWRSEQQGHADPCTYGPLCPWCEVERLRGAAELFRAASLHNFQTVEDVAKEMLRLRESTKALAEAGDRLAERRNDANLDAWAEAKRKAGV